MQCYQYRLCLMFYFNLRSLAFSVIWEMKTDATVVDVKYQKTVIKSRVYQYFHCYLLLALL